MLNLYTGFHAVEERVRAYSADKNSRNKTTAKEAASVSVKLFYSKPGPRIKKILGIAGEAGIECTQLQEKDLDSMVSSLPEGARDHRGIVLQIEGEKARAQNLVELDQWISTCPAKATVVILDSVTDPHNVGAILRSCDQFGANLLVMSDHRSANDIQGNDIIARTSAGASAYVPCSLVSNLVRSVQMLKDAGFWIYGADAGGTSLAETKFADRTCIIMGSEGSGMARLLEEQCDVIVSIPTCGKIDSLNVSVAAGVLLYERHRQDLSK